MIENLNKAASLNLSIGNMLLVGVVFLIVWAALRYVTQLLTFLGQRTPRMRFLTLLAAPIIRILAWFGAFIFAIEVLAPTRDAFLAALGSATIAIALGAQDLVKNLIGGLVIVTDRPYQMGDRVRMGDAYGEVQHVGLRSTKIMTPDDTLVTIPNSEILDSFSHNANAGVPEAMVVTEVHLPADVDPNLALEIGELAAITSPYTLMRKRRQILFKDQFSEAPYTTLVIKAYAYDHRWEPNMMSDITRRCKAEFLRRGLLKSWPGTD
jgi:small-conductance mechanosensitive channel